MKAILTTITIASIFSLLPVQPALPWDGYNNETGGMIEVESYDHGGTGEGPVDYYDYDSGEYRTGYLDMYPGGSGEITDDETGETFGVDMEL